MDLRAYFDILRRRGWIILTVAALAFVSTYGVSTQLTKIYRATVRISTVPARPDWGLGNSAKDLLRNFVNNINTHDMANQVINNAQLDMNSYDLLAKVAVSAEPENFLIRIDAKDQDPEVAKRIAKAMAQIFVDERVSYYDTQDKNNRIEVKLVDSVVDAPLFQPKPLMNGLVGGVLGALIGGLLVLALEWMSADILATASHVERALDLPVPGSIPWATGPGGMQVKDRLVSLSDPTSPTADAYRRLRTNLSSLGVGESLHTLLVVAAGADTDKASAVANLAVTFAKIGKRVVLADGDLRHPEQHSLFSLPNTEGISTAINHQGALPLPLQDTPVPCLHVLTSGPAVEIPSDLIASPGMGQLITRLRAGSDLVIFDAPPVILSTDAVELARQVDGVLLAVKAGSTKREDAQRAKEMLERVGARTIGVVLLNVPLEGALRKYQGA